jgi:hypothetical protein
MADSRIRKALFYGRFDSRAPIATRYLKQSRVRYVPSIVQKLELARCYF